MNSPTPVPSKEKVFAKVMESCAECGMSVEVGEYHPYAACLMYKACHTSATVRANLAAVRASTPEPRARDADLYEWVSGLVEALAGIPRAHGEEHIDTDYLAELHSRLSQPSAQSAELAELKKYHAEIVECDGGRECEAMRLTRWAIETIERAGQPPFDVQELLEIVREVSTMDCFYSGATCGSPDCKCLSARASRASVPRATATKGGEHGA